MQQRQLRLGDILDDYCPRERRVTNHAVVAMVGEDVKQTRCTTCDSEHEYKHAKVPRQRRKSETPAALYAHVVAGAPKRVTHEHAVSETPGDPGEKILDFLPALLARSVKRVAHRNHLALKTIPRSNPQHLTIVTMAASFSTLGAGFPGPGDRQPV